MASSHDVLTAVFTQSRERPEMYSEPTRFETQAYVLANIVRVWRGQQLLFDLTVVDSVCARRQQTDGNVRCV